MDVVIGLGVYGVGGFTTTKTDTIPSIDPSLNHTTIGALANTVNDYEFLYTLATWPMPMTGTVQSRTIVTAWLPTKLS